MAWNHKNRLHFEWENLGFLNGQGSEKSTSTEQSERRVSGAISNVSVYSSGSGTYSGNLENQIKHNNKEMALGDDCRIPSVIVGCICTGEPPIGLKLGKRTYFENLSSTNFKTSSSASMTRVASSAKRAKVSHEAIQHSYCQVEGCNIDLTAAKDYHRKHRVCVSHSKCPRVIVAGHERRFCQQCSRFHDLSEFDQKKRSCRRRLSDHNARRRKPQPETISLKPSSLPPAFYDEKQMNFFLNLAPISHVRQPSSTCSSWDHSHGFSSSVTEGSWIKPTKSGVDQRLNLPLIDFTDTINGSCGVFNRLKPFKLSTTEVLNLDQEASLSTSNINGAPDLQHALSLLSNDSWGPPSTVQSSMTQLASNEPITASHCPVQVVESSAPECWLDYHSLAEQTLTFNLHDDNVSHIQELHLGKAPFESPLFEGSQFFKSGCHFLESKT